MSQNSTNIFLAALTFLLGVLGVLVIKSLFENDSSKIISKKGQIFLNDDEKMKAINRKIDSTDEKHSYKEVLV